MGGTVWTGFALVVAVAISLLLGHVVTVAAFAVIIARRKTNAAGDALGSRWRSASQSTWKITIAAALVAFAGAAALLVVTAPNERMRLDTGSVGGRAKWARAFGWSRLTASIPGCWKSLPGPAASPGWRPH